MRICPACSARYRGEIRRCPFDGATLDQGPIDLAGSKLADRFELLDLLGAGAIGEVYRASDLATKRSVALKLLHLDLASDRVHRDRFSRETRAMMRVRHPSVVDVLATSEADEQRPWFAMALYAGATLASRLSRLGALEPELALSIVVRVAGALAAAHAAGVVHRDLKPANIILEGCEPDVVPIVLDFGMASVQGEPGLTETGELVGTPQYMSPEQIRGQPPCPTMDHYALGVLLFEMLTGRAPFVGKASAVLDAHLTEPPPSARAFGVKLAIEIESALRGLLAKGSDERTLAFAKLVARSPG